MLPPQFCTELSAQIRAVGAYIKQERQQFSSQAIEVKGKNDLVSYVDKEAERRLIEVCKKLLPESGFIGEESGNTNTQAEWRWIIDPLDGTTNFMHGLPFFAVSVALQYQQETVLGCVYDIMHEQLFFAQKGQGATLNGEKIRVSATESLAESLIATGFPYTRFEWMEDYMRILTVLMPNSRGIRRAGSAALDLVYTAMGCFDGFFEFGLNAWDVAAGALIVTEAGGSVTDFQGGQNYLFGREILASNGRIQAEFRQIIVSSCQNSLLTKP